MPAPVGARRLVAVLEVVEATLGGRLQVDGAHLARGTRIAVVVEDEDVVGGLGAPDRARSLQPLVGQDHRARALGGRVVLGDDRSPPLDDRLLHGHRAGRGTVHDEAQRLRDRIEERLDVGAHGS